MPGALVVAFWESANVAERSLVSNMGISLVVVSLIVWLIVFVIWYRFDMRRITSPMFVYLLFHFVSFVFRPWQIAVGLDMWIPTNVGFLPDEQDYIFAVVLANLGLIALGLGSVLGNRKARGNYRNVPSHIYSSKTSLVVGSVILVLGIASLIAFGNTPLYQGISYMDSGSGSSTVLTIPGVVSMFSYLIPGVIAVWILVRGPRWWYFPPLIFYFASRAYTGWSRFTLLLGVFLIVFSLLQRKRLAWPTRGQLAVLILTVVVFLGGKSWGKEWFDNGASSGIASMQSWISTQLEGQGSDFNTYDMLVVVTSTVPSTLPHTGLLFYYAPFISLVPRAVWSDKPVDDLLPSVYINRGIAFGTSAPSLVGESYIGFGVLGVIGVMGLAGYLFAYVCARAQRAPAGSVLELVGVVLPVIILQTARDGLYSISYFFLFFFGAGLIIWVLDKRLMPHPRLHPVNPVRRKSLKEGSLG